MSRWLARFARWLEDKTNQMRRAHGLPEDHRPSEYRKKKEAEKKR